MPRRKLFSIVKPDDSLIVSWIAVKSSWRGARLLIPWFWGPIGLEWGWPFSFCALSAWREQNIGKD
jgi:hypothetical protein